MVQAGRCRVLWMQSRGCQSTLSLRSVSLSCPIHVLMADVMQMASVRLKKLKLMLKLQVKCGDARSDGQADLWLVGGSVRWTSMKWVIPR